MSKPTKKNEERDFSKEYLEMAGSDFSAQLPLSRSAKSFYEMLNQEINGNSPSSKSSVSDYSGKSFGSNNGSVRRFKIN